MPSEIQVEHFCTLFDGNFLPQGLALHESLLRHCPSFKLWILCMDEVAEQQLREIALPHVYLIALRDIESPPLLAVKTTRTRAEYCWTLTPFVFQAVFHRAPSIGRVTYLDADLFFFDNPDILLEEFTESGKHVLITEHAYGPEYRDRIDFGRFCVQFLTARNTPEGKKIMTWWEEKCLEWCYNRKEDGKFGDQKYLDAWPDAFGSDVHILKQVEKTLAPWNIRHLDRQSGGANPVFYHFHSLRIVAPGRIKLYTNHRVGKRASRLYKAYVEVLVAQLRFMHAKGYAIPVLPQERPRFGWLGTLKLTYLNRIEQYQYYRV